MLVYDPAVGIVHCYNGITNSSTGDCGFVLTLPIPAQTGIYRINFGFPVSARFVAVSAKYGKFGNSQNNNGGANYRLFDSTSVEVFTFDADSVDTFQRGFTIILF
jgi:hypothetical protein